MDKTSKYTLEAPLTTSKYQGDAVSNLVQHQQEVNNIQLQVNGNTQGGGRRKSRRRRKRRRRSHRKRRKGRRKRRRRRTQRGGDSRLTQCNGPGCNLKNLAEGQQLLVKIGTQAEYDGGGRRRSRRRGYRNRTRRRGRCVVCLRRL